LSVVGIDLGAKCGFALLTDDGYRITSGTWRLGRRSGEAVVRFEELLEKLFAEGVKAVGYEKVRRHRGVEAAHAYGAYEAILWKACHVSGVLESSIVQVSVQEIKRLATGSGNADKDDMEAAAMAQWAYVPDDDNEADALWVAESARLRTK
jgi:Holliday junction resolvasome RuvABC endonuclease subunit